MDFICNFPLFSIVLSLFSGVLCFMLKAKAARRYTIAYEFVLIVFSLCVLIYTATKGESFTYTMGEFSAPWGNEIRAGVLEGLTALVFMIIMFCSVIAGYHFVLKDIDETKRNLYYALLNLMTAALMALIYTNDIFTGYVFLEILTLTTCGVLIVREIGRTTLAAVRYMILNLLGSGLFLLGVVLLYGVTGQLLMVPMQETIASMTSTQDITSITLATGILTVGLCIKSGLFPFHFWMPDTYGYSTPTSASVLSSLVSKAYIFLLFKIYYRSIGIEAFEKMPIKNILLILGICGMVFGSVSAIRTNHLNSMIAFSSAAQIGYIFMGIGIGTTAGYVAALFQIFAHSVTKSMLFLTTPRLAEVSGDLMTFHDLQGSAQKNRCAGAVFTVGALSMIGIPIFAGFAAKLFLGIAGIDTGDPVRMLLVMLALAISSLLNAVYFVRTIIRIYSNPENGIKKEEIHNSLAPSYTIPMGILTAVNLFFGLFSWVVVGLIESGLAMF